MSRLAETVALIWPGGAGKPHRRRSRRWLHAGPHAKAELPRSSPAWLDASEASVRFALLKLITGGLRVGASARLAKLALAEMADGRLAADDIEEVWHGLAPPYAELFAWVEARPARSRRCAVFRPPMLAHPLEPGDLLSVDPAAWRPNGNGTASGATGVHFQAESACIARGGDISRRSGNPGGDGFHAVLDGELLVIRDGNVAPFADLQQR